MVSGLPDHSIPRHAPSSPLILIFASALCEFFQSALAHSFERFIGLE
jgi:hypothetical protein